MPSGPIALVEGRIIQESRNHGGVISVKLWEEVTPSAETKGKVGTSRVRGHMEKGLVHERTEEESKAEGTACANVLGCLRC